MINYLDTVSKIPLNHPSDVWMNCVYMASCDDAPEHHLLNIMESPFQCLDEFDVCVVRHVMIYLNSL